jgi:hypothetical protein
MHQGYYFGFVAVFFGFLGMAALYSFARKILSPCKLKDRKHWLYTHIGNMGGGYISTWTAFLVVNIDFLPNIVVWLLPTVIGIPLIAYAIRKQKLKVVRENR